MPFDNLLGVGRTPQITKDFVVQNPFTTIASDIAPAATVNQTITGTATSQAGKPQNIVDANIDTDTIAYQISYGVSADNVTTLVVDLGREYYIKEASMNYNIDLDGAGGLTVTYSSLQISNDGIAAGYSGVGTSVGVGTVPLNIRLQANYFKTRFIRFFLTTTSTTVGHTIKFYKFKAILEEMQR